MRHTEARNNKAARIIWSLFSGNEPILGK